MMTLEPNPEQKGSHGGDRGHDVAKADEYVIGVDLGGTKVEAVLLDSHGNSYDRLREPAGASRGLAYVEDNILSLIDRTAGGRPYTAVGVGTPGTYSQRDDRLYGSPHTPVYEAPGFIRGLRERLSVPVLVENDANCLALAEYYAACADKYRCVMAVILGTGVGSGLILNGRLYRGARGGAGEFGHATIDINGRQCECGRRGCAEAYLSGPSHSRRFSEKTGKSMNLPGIYRLYEAGDADAVDLLEESCRLLGEALANVVSILDLDAVILGGGVSNLPLWYRKIPGRISQAAFGLKRPDFPVLKAKLGDSAGVFGAAYLALRERGFMDF